MTSAINYQRLFIFVFFYISFGAFMLPYFIELLPIKQTCIFSSLTGHPSPTCGATRALVSLLHLNPVLAFQFNPLATTVWATCFFFSLFLLISGKARLLSILDKIRPNSSIVWTLALATGMNWLYLLWHEDFLHQNALETIPLLF